MYSDLRDFKNTMIRGGTRYYIIFANDRFRFTKL